MPDITQTVWPSRIIPDIGDIFGYETLFVPDVQAHGIDDDQQQFSPASRIRDGDPVKGGRPLFLHPAGQGASRKRAGAVAAPSPPGRMPI